MHKDAWSRSLVRCRSQHRRVESIINRYYDPTTDEFLSIDHEVAQTDQPYVFTNDRPLNAEDPLGLKGGPGTGCLGHANASACEKQAVKRVDDSAGESALGIDFLTVLLTIPLDENGVGEASERWPYAVFDVNEETGSVDSNASIDRQ